MTSTPPENQLSGEEVAAILATAGVDPNAERIERLRQLIDVDALRTGDRALALRDAILLVNRELDLVQTQIETGVDRQHEYADVLVDMFHGTTRFSWGLPASRDMGPLYLTKTRGDALSYAEETAQNEAIDRDDVEPILVTFSAAAMQTLFDHGATLSPDTGWIEFHYRGKGAPEWRQSLEEYGSVCVHGFVDDMKQLGLVEPLTRVIAENVSSGSGKDPIATEPPPLPAVSVEVQANADGTDIADRDSDTVVLVREGSGQVVGLIYGNRIDDVFEVSVSQLNDQARGKGYYRAALLALSHQFTVISDTQLSGAAERAYRAVGGRERLDNRMEIRRVVGEGGPSAAKVPDAMPTDDVAANGARGPVLSYEM